MQYLGYKREGTHSAGSASDRFRIGSNTKAITAAIARQMVAERKITWDTKLLNLCPELRHKCDTTFLNITLQDLLDMQVPFPSYTYTDKKPTRKQINPTGKSDAIAERANFVAWFLYHKPVKEPKYLYMSNVSYACVGLMLERAAGKKYEELVHAYGEKLHISFGIGSPNAKDSTQVWGHTHDNAPEPPGESYKLNWLLPAGNINVTLPDYVRFIQNEMHGLPATLSDRRSLKHQDNEYRKREFNMGWFWDILPHSNVSYHNLGNPGSFTTEVYISPSIDRAYIVFTNSQNENTYTAVAAMMAEMKSRYGY